MTQQTHPGSPGSQTPDENPDENPAEGAENAAVVTSAGGTERTQQLEQTNPPLWASNPNQGYGFGTPQEAPPTEWFGAGVGASNGPGGPGGTYGGHPVYPTPTPTPSPRNKGSKGVGQLTAVALLAAVLASGGTFVATRYAAPAPASTITAATTTQSNGSSSPQVIQGSATAPDWTATAKAVAPSVVSITVASAQAEGQGSGVVLDGQGHILTNNHVATGAGTGATISVTLNDGRTYDAKIVGTDPTTDLAVLLISNPPSDLVPVSIGDSTSLVVGQPVMAIGNPLGLSGTVTTGIVSALNRPVTTQASESNTQDQQGQGPQGQGQQGQGQQGQGQQGQGQQGQGQQGQGQQGQGQQGTANADTVVTNAIQTSAAINPGNSGGALVTADGKLIGINSSIASLGSSSTSQSGSIGIGFAIPSNEAKSIADQLISSGKAEHAYIGVSASDTTVTDGSSKRQAALVQAVTAGTPAAAAGLQAKDAVIAIDGESIQSSESLVAAIHEHKVGDTVTITVVRGSQQQDLKVTLAARPG